MTNDATPNNGDGTMIVAEICLYGNGPRGCGAGWLATMSDGTTLGTGEPVADCDFTTAVYDAIDAVQRHRITFPGKWAGGPLPLPLVRVFASCGTRYADMPLHFPVTYGSVNWQPAAPALVITVAS